MKKDIFHWLTLAFLIYVGGSLVLVVLGNPLQALKAVFGIIMGSAFSLVAMFVVLFVIYALFYHKAR